MKKDSRIYVAGHRGLVGSALVRQLRGAGYENLILRTHQELDLCSQAATADFFSEQRPEFVFLAAARVGGIMGNQMFRGEFIYENLCIQNNVIHQSYRAGVQRLLFLGSSCIYPKLCPQPMKEEYLLTGEMEATNRPYAIAKIAGIEMCWAYNRQFGTKFVAAMPTNLYGRGDNYDLATSHVIPALIRKLDDAKRRNKDEVVLWGTGTPKREFLHSDDVADACVFLMKLPESEFATLLREDRPALINIGCGVEMTIRQLADLISSIIGYKGRVVFDASMPDGTPRKLMDVSLMRSMGWKPRVELYAGLADSYREYCERFALA
jgi:GDP-L-fucose synthase